MGRALPEYEKDSRSYRQRAYRDWTGRNSHSWISRKCIAMYINVSRQEVVLVSSPKVRPFPCTTRNSSKTSLLLGGSHDRTDLLPLKAGVSLMALGAMANHPEVKVKIVPVGLSYFHAHKFRSRAVIEFGSAMDVPEDLVDMFKLGGPQKREGVTKLLNLVYDGLKTVTIRAPDYDTLMVKFFSLYPYFGSSLRFLP